MTIAILVAALAAQAIMVDRTLAIVSGRTITLSDTRAAVALGLVESRVDVGDVDPEVVQRLVDREVMLREVERYQPPEPGADRVAAGVAAARARAGGDEALARILRDTGLTEERLRAWVRDDLRIAAYLQRRFISDERRADLIADWLSDLRRRAEIIVLP